MTELSRSRRRALPIPTPPGLKELGCARTAERHAVARTDITGYAYDRRCLDHDVLHQLGTILLLASLVSESTDPESRRRARQIMTETRWLEKLVRSNRDVLSVESQPDRRTPRTIRLDSFVERVVATARLLISTRVRLEATPVQVRVEPVTFGRAMRNLIWNGLEAAGPDGELAVRVAELDGLATLDVEDSGPGYHPEEAQRGHMGLEIVRQIVASCNGELRIGAGPAGGCQMRLILPTVRT
ncbi:MAG: hypothetical protein QOG80_2800 [Pseudonocardiales bacterium]|jgi:signal transduction histidine kinase|nr:hypothetical protein [Pseudonocardiales bacterium]